MKRKKKLKKKETNKGRKQKRCELKNNSSY